ncbi:GMC family oxidoreductase N-terminal domain-containing protein [Georgenia sp. AZ-5]|uniref:GMC family oxidoreductase N-terminal domain-containing protein n=1 Tax=Georgenia sp. AZ-5 TaxID=3367526 RepID=UPI0037551E1F
MPPKNYWPYAVQPDPTRGGRQDSWASGKVLGGSSSVKAMLWVRGHRAGFDERADLGADGWDYDSLLPFMRKVERFGTARTSTAAANCRSRSPGSGSPTRWSVDSSRPRPRRRLGRHTTRTTTARISSAPRGRSSPRRAGCATTRRGPTSGPAGPAR